MEMIQWCFHVEDKREGLGGRIKDWGDKELVGKDVGSSTHLRLLSMDATNHNGKIKISSQLVPVKIEFFYLHTEWVTILEIILSIKK